MAYSQSDWSANTGRMQCTLPDIPPSPVPQLLRTNLVPSSSQTAAIQTTIQTVDALKVQLDSELAAVTHKFSQRRDELIQFAQLHERLLAPERRLPLEILARIFIHYVEGKKYIYMCVSARAVLCAVCRTWRNIAISTPLLWTSFSLVIRPGDTRDIVEMSATWLPRAGSLPMFVEVRNLGVMIPQALIDVLSLHSANWQDVDLTLWPIELMRLTDASSDSTWQLPLLRTLDLHALISTERDVSISVFADAPQLRCIRLKNLGPLDVTLPWAQITACQSRGRSVHDALDLLAVCPRLLEWDLEIFHGDVSTRGIYCSPELCSLRIGVQALTVIILDHLSLPSLRDLRVAWTGSVQASTLSLYLVPLITRSACSLQGLELLFAMDSISDSDLIDCLRAVPTVTDLTLHFGRSTSNVTDNVLLHLTHGGARQCLLPNLLHVEFDLHRSPCTSVGLLSMARSRCVRYTEGGLPRPVAQLQTLSLLSVGFQLDAVSTKALEAIASDSGLKLNVSSKSFAHKER